MKRTVALPIGRLSCWHSCVLFWAAVPLDGGVRPRAGSGCRAPCPRHLPQWEGPQGSWQTERKRRNPAFLTGVGLPCSLPWFSSVLVNRSRAAPSPPLGRECFLLCLPSFRHGRPHVVAELFWYVSGEMKVSACWHFIKESAPLRERFALGDQESTGRTLCPGWHWRYWG